ncbi:MAG: ATP-binding cassette domain-containing protein [Clostridiales bacterium]|nr:ATP-binding cassette domain-containing protein [Clostridiales bacterium]
MVEVLDVGKLYGRVEALRNVSLTAQKGRVLGLLGQNGAGKTTLLNIITGCLAPTSGSVKINGKDPLLNPAQAKRVLGYMPEHPPLYDEMTVEEYLRFASELKKVPRADIPGHVRGIMRSAGLTEMRSRLLSHLSKGYRQRVGLAQALCGDPEVLVLDEPTTGLDPKQITEIRALIQTLSNEHTIIFSSHILPEVRQLCDSVAILHRGELKLDADLDSLGGGSATVHCRIQGEAKKLYPALQHMDDLQSMQALPSSDPNVIAVSLTFGKTAMPEKQVFTLCSALNAPILRMTRHEDDLEQIFLQAIAE